MSLADRLAAGAPEPRKLGKCIVVRLIDELHAIDPVDAEALQAAVDGDYRGAALIKNLAAEGYSISLSSLRNHRRTECACWMKM